MRPSLRAKGIVFAHITPSMSAPFGPFHVQNSARNERTMLPSRRPRSPEEDAQEEQFPVSKRRRVSEEKEGLLSLYNQSPYQTMEIEREAEREEPRVPNPTEQQEFIPTLPTEVLWNIVGRLGPAGVSRARGVSRAFQDIGASMLQRIETRTRNTVCPDSAICKGSLLCAVASDDVQSVQNILFLERTLPGNMKLTGDDTIETLKSGPCRVMKWTGLPDLVSHISAVNETLTLDAFAVETSAINVLAFLMPSIIRRGAHVWGKLVNRAIKLMGHCIWIAHFTDTASASWGSLRNPPTTNAAHWHAQVRAASAISWRGQLVGEPGGAGGNWDDRVLNNAITLGGVQWTTVLCDSLAMTRILLAPATPPLGVMRLVGRTHTNFLLTLVESIIKTSRQFGLWTEILHKELIVGRTESVNNEINSMPSAYVKLFRDMNPFYTTPVTNATEYEQFQETIIAMQDTFYQDLLSITGWMDLLDVLLDAGLHPYQGIGKGSRATVLQSQRELAMRFPQYTAPTTDEVLDPMNRSFKYWVEQVVTVRILADIEEVYRQRGLVYDLPTA